MARTTKAREDQPGGQPPVPSFSATAHPPTVDTPPQPEPRSETPPSDEESFEKWYEGVPQNFKDEYWKRATTYVNGVIDQQFGDIMPAVLEIAADPDLRKGLARLSNKDAAAFALKNALDIFDKTGTVPDGEDRDSQLSKAVTDRLDKIDEREKQREETARYNEYVKYRNDEVGALVNEHPELRWANESDANFKHVSHLVDLAHMYSQRYNRFVSIREVYDREREFGTVPPPAAPATSRAEVGRENPQAPTTVVESTQRMAEQIKKAGGFRNLAETASRRRG